MSISLRTIYKKYMKKRIDQYIKKLYDYIEVLNVRINGARY